MTDDQIFEAVDKLLKTQINPAVAQHGGKVDLIDVSRGSRRRSSVRFPM
jgi:Fe-S cluster biogenesis protein NfuA